MKEQTLVVVKPDGVKRGLVGEIISRFERAGLKVVASRMVSVPRDLAEKHYPANREDLWVGIGHKTLSNYKELEMDAKELLGTSDPRKIGDMVRVWLLEYIASGPVCAVVLEGPHAVELVRKITGHTLPAAAAPGTIRGDLSYDSAYLANTGRRAIKNLIHASGSEEEAKYEIPLWFKKDEIVYYKRPDEEAMR